jgi:phosphatidylglycerophosphatase C
VPAPVVAAFDVDNTLTVRDCVVPFLRRVAGTVRLTAGIARRGPAVVPALARRDRDALKAAATLAALGGRRLDEVTEHGHVFGKEIAAGWLRPDTVARLSWHRDQGHDVVLVSASYEVYLHAVADELGAVGVLGSRLAVADGRVVGLEGANCRGAEKVRRLHEWLEGTHGGRGDVVVYAYGDSAGDRELLADADHPLLVGRRGVTAAPT